MNTSHDAAHLLLGEVPCLAVHALVQVGVHILHHEEQRILQTDDLFNRHDIRVLDEHHHLRDECTSHAFAYLHLLQPHALLPRHVLLLYSLNGDLWRMKRATCAYDFACVDVHRLHHHPKRPITHTVDYLQYHTGIGAAYLIAFHPFSNNSVATNGGIILSEQTRR